MIDVSLFRLLCLDFVQNDGHLKVLLRDHTAHDHVHELGRHVALQVGVGVLDHVQLVADSLSDREGVDTNLEAVFRLFDSIGKLVHGGRGIELLTIAKVLDVALAQTITVRHEHGHLHHIHEHARVAGGRRLEHLELGDFRLAIHVGLDVLEVDVEDLGRDVRVLAGGPRPDARISLELLRVDITCNALFLVAKGGPLAPTALLVEVVLVVHLPKEGLLCRDDQVFPLGLISILVDALLSFEHGLLEGVERRELVQVLHRVCIDGLKLLVVLGELGIKCSNV